MECSEKCPIYGNKQKVEISYAADVHGMHVLVNDCLHEKHGKCLYTAVREFHDSQDKVIIKPWHIVEKRWLRPGETCLLGSYEFRLYRKDKEETS